VTDERLEEIMGKLLLAGVALAAAVVLAGGVWLVAAGGMARVDYRQFHAQTRGWHAISRLAAPEAVILVGLLILIATPVARVVFALVGFALERDRLYVAISAFVLGVLIYSILL
jgi:uncharacterized membrane protein